MQFQPTRRPDRERRIEHSRAEKLYALTAKGEARISCPKPHNGVGLIRPLLRAFA